MRTPEEILKMILDIADTDPRILAVGLQGSRSTDREVDRFSDFDVVYVVDRIQPFLLDPTWIDRFGKRRILQTPDDFYNTTFDSKTATKFAWLMQFQDQTRIDLTLIEKDEIQFDELEMKVILDKTGEITPLISSTESFPNKEVNEKEFHDTVNEFWWLTYYVAKGICRNEALYAKACFDLLLEMTSKVIRWRVFEEDESAQVGKFDRHLQRYLDPPRYENYLACFPTCRLDDIRDKLISIMRFFDEIARELADLRSFTIQEDTLAIQAEIRSILKETKGLGL